MAKTTRLGHQRALLNPHFQGYRLQSSLGDLLHATRTVPLPGDGVGWSLLSWRHASGSAFKRLRTLALHNRLVKNPFSDDILFFVDGRGKLQGVHVQSETLETSIFELFQIEEYSAKSGGESDLPSVAMATPSLLVLGDGSGALYILSFSIERSPKSPTSSSSGTTALKCSLLRRADGIIPSYGFIVRAAGATVTRQQVICALECISEVPQTSGDSESGSRSSSKGVSSSSAAAPFSRDSSSSTRDNAVSAKFQHSIYVVVVGMENSNLHLTAADASSAVSSSAPASSSSFSSSRILMHAVGKHPSKFVGFEPNLSGMIVVADGPFEPVFPSASVDASSLSSSSKVVSSSSDSHHMEIGDANNQISAKDDDASESSSNPYKWSQTVEDLTLVFPLSSLIASAITTTEAANFNKTTQKKDIACTFRTDRLTLSVGGKTIIDGELNGPIATDGCHWSIEASATLTVYLEKVHRARWPSVFLEDDGVMETLAEDDLRRFADRLRSYTSDSPENPHLQRASNPISHTFDQEQEACDLEGEYARIMRFSLVDSGVPQDDSRAAENAFVAPSFVSSSSFSSDRIGVLTHVVESDPHEFLCTAYPEIKIDRLQDDSNSNSSSNHPENAEDAKIQQQSVTPPHRQSSKRPAETAPLPMLGFKSDVDCIFFTVSQNFDLEHTNTFDALGYVQASKRERKFTAVSRNAAYAVIAESQRHAFVYRGRRANEEAGLNSDRQAESTSHSNWSSQTVVELPYQLGGDVMGLQPLDERRFAILHERQIFILDLLA